MESIRSWCHNEGKVEAPKHEMQSLKSLENEWAWIINVTHVALAVKDKLRRNIY